MRHRTWGLMALAVLLATLSACTVREYPIPDCNMATLSGASIQAAERASTCAPTLSYDGLEYQILCIPVRPRLLRDEPVFGLQDPGSETIEHWEGRAIQGVSPSIAIAVRHTVTIKGEDRDRAGICGDRSWGFAPKLGKITNEVEAVIERVAIPGSYSLT